MLKEIAKPIESAGLREEEALQKYNPSIALEYSDNFNKSKYLLE